MKDNFLLVLGIALVLVRRDYVGKGFREEFRRLGRKTLNRLNK